MGGAVESAARRQPEKALIENAVILEELDRDLYRSKSLWRPTGARGVFGGQVVGQSLMAATRSVEGSAFQVHSLHSFFLLPGDPELPIIYKVNRVRDGKSYCTRTIHALQKGRNIFVCEVSFHVPEPSSLEHQYPMPATEDPERLPSYSRPACDRIERLILFLSSFSREQLVQGILDDPQVTPDIGSSIRFHIFEPFDLEIRFTEPITVQSIREGRPKEARQSFWIRVGHRLPDDPRLHQCVAAYATDHLLLSTSLRPAGLHMWNPRVTFMATLDHCIWFHSAFRVDDWLLYTMESPRATSGRGFCLGRLYDQQGRLVLSCAQEGVVRIRETSLTLAAPSAASLNSKSKL